MRGNVSTFADRIHLGEAAQKELAARLRGEGFAVLETGQENWITAQVHAALRFEHEDLMARAVRYFPDLLAWRVNFPLAYWEAKANATPDTPNFAIEKACYDEGLARVGSQT